MPQSKLPPNTCLISALRPGLANVHPTLQTACRCVSEQQVRIREAQHLRVLIKLKVGLYCPLLFYIISWTANAACEPSFASALFLADSHMYSAMAYSLTCPIVSFLPSNAKHAISIFMCRGYRVAVICQCTCSPRQVHTALGTNKDLEIAVQPRSEACLAGSRSRAALHLYEGSDSVPDTLA